MASDRVWAAAVNHCPACTQPYLSEAECKPDACLQGNLQEEGFGPLLLLNVNVLFY